MARVTTSPGSSQRPSVCVLDLEQAARADRAAAEDLARANVDVRRRAREHLRRTSSGRPPTSRARPRPFDRRRRRRSPSSRGPAPSRRRAIDRRARRASRSTARSTSRSPCPWRARAGRVDSSRWRSRADQSFSDEVAADRLRGALLGQVVRRGVDDRPDLELEVELLLPARRPDRVARAADLRDVREVEDREAVPGLRDLAPAAAPHRRDVLLEGVEVAERGWPQDRRPEGEISPLPARHRRRRRARRRRPRSRRESRRVPRSAGRARAGRRAS